MEAERATAGPAHENQGRRSRLPVLLVAVLAATAGACSLQPRVIGGGAGPVLGAPVRLAPGAVRADFTVVGDATQILKESAGDSLQAAGMTCHGPGAACATIDLHARIGQSAAPFAAASPPVRVVELIANYRAPGAEHPSATVSYQRTLAAPGDLSTATWMRISDALMNDLAADFSFRSRKSGIVIRLPSWATGQSSLVRAAKQRAFHVASTSDGRADDDTIGSVGTHEVRLARRATDYITEMLTDELRGAGHTIVPAKDGRLVGSELEKFWIASDQGPGGWKTTAEIELALEVGPPPGVKRKKAERHSCSVTESSLRAPGEPELARILQKCLADLVRSIRNDSAWSLGDS